MALTPVVISLARRFQMFDAPDHARRVHHQPVPRIGGVAVFAAAIAVTLVLSPETLSLGRGHGFAGLLLGASVMFVLGLVDDLRGLSPVAKFGGQLLAAGGAVWLGGYPTELAITAGTTVHIGWFGAPLLLVWIVAVTNAYNLIDGLNGLATGIAVVACVGALAIAAFFGHSLVPVLALVGALIGFLRYNFPAARIFLGDSGTMSIGFLLAMLLMRAATSPAGSVLVLVPICAMMVPFLDTGLAILRRWLRSVPLSGADARHIHHRLLALGLTQQQTVVALWGLSACFTAFGLLVALTTPAVAGIISAIGSGVLALVIIYGTNVLAYHELSVAREVLIQGPKRIRRVISDQILALDLCQAIRNAPSIHDLNALLLRNAAVFGFSRMELRTERRGHGARDGRHERRRSRGTAAWRLDFFLAHESEHEVTLSIWCGGMDSRLSGAERVARILGPAITAWASAHPAPRSFDALVAELAAEPRVELRHPLLEQRKPQERVVLQ